MSSESNEVASEAKPAIEKASVPEVNTSAEPIAALLGDEARPVDPVVEARVLRKIDAFLMPAMLIGMRIARNVRYRLLTPNRIWPGLLR